MSESTEASAGEMVGAELADLLPRLPRVKITPQTISQTIIDRWYGYETEYRQTIAGLRAELAEVRELHQLSEAQLVEVTLERAEWRKRAQQHEIVAKILRADLAAANKQAKEQAAAHDHWLCYAGDIEIKLGAERERAGTAEKKLAELQMRIGQESVQWGVRYTAGVDGTGADCSEEEDPVDYCDDRADATQLAAQTPGAIPVWHLRGEWKAVGDA